MFILPCITEKSQAIYEFIDSTVNETYKENQFKKQKRSTLYKIHCQITDLPKKKQIFIPEVGWLPELQAVLIYNT